MIAIKLGRKLMSNKLKDAYNITALDFAANGNMEMYDFFQDEIVRISGVPKEFLGEAPKKPEFLMAKSRLTFKQKLIKLFKNKI